MTCMSPRHKKFVLALKHIHFFSRSTPTFLDGSLSVFPISISKPPPHRINLISISFFFSYLPLALSTENPRDPSPLTMLKLSSTLSTHVRFLLQSLTEANADSVFRELCQVFSFSINFSMSYTPIRYFFLCFISQDSSGHSKNPKINQTLTLDLIYVYTIRLSFVLVVTHCLIRL